MNNVVSSFHGRNPFVKGLLVKAAVLLAGAAFFVTALEAKAGSQITQGEYLGWLASVSGDSPSDLLQWATDKGLAPDGGWSLDKKLNKQVLAQTLVQLFEFNPKAFKGDYQKILLRQGIALTEEEEITREGLMRTLDQFGVQGPTYTMVTSTGSGTNGDWGHDGNMPPPGFRNPKNPHYNNGNVLPPGSLGNGRRNR